MSGGIGEARILRGSLVRAALLGTGSTCPYHLVNTERVQDRDCRLQRQVGASSPSISVTDDDFTSGLYISYNGREAVGVTSN